VAFENLRKALDAAKRDGGRGCDIDVIHQGRDDKGLRAETLGGAGGDRWRWQGGDLCVRGLLQLSSEFVKGRLDCEAEEEGG
jgi:hypothetical protein